MSEDVTKRFNVHNITDTATLNWMAQMRRTYAEAARELDTRLPPCREKSTAITKLEEAMFWTSAAAARMNGEPNGYGDIEHSHQAAHDAEAGGCYGKVSVLPVENVFSCANPQCAWTFQPHE